MHEATGQTRFNRNQSLKQPTCPPCLHSRHQANHDLNSALSTFLLSPPFFDSADNLAKSSGVPAGSLMVLPLASVNGEDGNGVEVDDEDGEIGANFFISNGLRNSTGDLQMEHTGRVLKHL